MGFWEDMDTKMRDFDPEKSPSKMFVANALTNMVDRYNEAQERKADNLMRVYGRSESSAPIRRKGLFQSLVEMQQGRKRQELDNESDRYLSERLRNVNPELQKLLDALDYAGKAEDIRKRANIVPQSSLFSGERP